MKNLPMYLLFTLFNSTVSAQIAPTFEWYSFMDGFHTDRLWSVAETADSCFILGGYSESGITGDKTEESLGFFDYWIIKVDAEGDIIWQNTIGGSDYDFLSSIIQTSDGGFLAGGHSLSGISGDKTEVCLELEDYWIVKLDASGNIIWQNTIGAAGEDLLKSVVQTTDGGYLLGGQSNSSNQDDKNEPSLGGSDFWIIKVDANGNIIWQNTIGGSNSDHFMSAIQTTDGGYLVGGYTNSGISGDKTEANQGQLDFWILKLDSIGSIIWQNTIGGNLDDVLQALIETSDGGYLLGGTSSSDISGDKTEEKVGGGDYWIVKLDAEGNIVWQNTIGGNGGDDLISIIQASDGGYLLGGSSFSNISGDKTEPSIGNTKDFWIVKVDDLGNVTWQYTIGYDKDDVPRSVIQTMDGGYLVGGYSQKPLTSSAYWVVKTGPEIATGFVAHSNQKLQLRIFPNPSSGQITIESKMAVPSNFFIEVYDVIGRRVFQSDEVNTGNNFTKKIDLGYLPKGIYQCNLILPNYNVTQSVVVE